MSTHSLRSHCPINFALEAFGDKWSLLILRDIIFRGKMTYGEFLNSEEGFSTNILASRLSHFVEQNILTHVIDANDSRKGAYHLTEKGLDLIPIMFEMMVWSLKYDQFSEARRIPQLMKLIAKNNRKFSETVKSRLRKGSPLFPDYLR